MLWLAGANEAEILVAGEAWLDRPRSTRPVPPSAVIPFRQEMLMVYLQLSTDTEFAHRLQQRDDCFKNKLLRAPLFVLPAQRDFDLTVIGGTDCVQYRPDCFIQLL